MHSPEEIKQILKASKFRPKDYMGQNFLVDQDVLDRIVSAADLKPSDEVLEVGPGLGVLTSELVKKCSKVVAVEKDRRFFGLIKRQFKHQKNLDLVNADILRFNIGESFGKSFKVVANIPYYLTSKFISLLLTLRKKPESIVVLVQKEVAERAAAKPGDLSVLGLSVQFFADPEIIGLVKPGSFWPMPKVDSAILKIVPKPKFPSVDEKMFFWVLKAAFAGKRKQLHNSLSNNLHVPEDEVLKKLSASGIDPVLRPQQLTLSDWVRLSEQFISK
ncbi:MAG: 16S rRNA (adenine(1518)-N(6)/adenine(1519)-N(6))-dimethyltransferase RsmA [Acidobacteriaceae bacterium]